MERLKEFLDWHCENPHNVNFKMIVAKEDREETLNGMHEMSKLLDTGLTPEKIVELKERDTAKAPIDADEDYGFFTCPSCGEAIYASDDFASHKFCLNCGQRLKWRD